MKSSRGCTTRATSTASKPRRPRRDARCGHLHVAGIGGDCRLAAGARRSGRRARPRAAASRRSRWCGRRATTPSATARWASVSTTTSRSPRRPRAPAELARVAIVDIDVHHGNGTQWIVLRRSPCCTCPATSFPSTREPARPTKSARATARGFTVNVPLEAGANDADYFLAYAARRPGARTVRARS